MCIRVAVAPQLLHWSVDTLPNDDADHRCERTACCVQIATQMSSEHHAATGTHPPGCATLVGGDGLSMGHKSECSSFCGWLMATYGRVLHLRFVPGHPDTVNVECRHGITHQHTV